MDLFRHCLDLPLLDRTGRRMGRVDGIILELEPNRQPRVAGIETGMVTAIDRLSVKLGQRVVSLLKRAGIKTDRYQIPWGNVRIGLNQIEADVEGEKTEALALEMWLRKHVIGKIPGA